MDNLQVLLKRRPVGLPAADDFELRGSDIPQPGENQVLVRNRWLSLDPYMRGRMSDAKSYATPVQIGGVMTGGTVGEVVASGDPGFKPGDMVLGTLGWQLYGVAEAGSLRKIADTRIPLSAYLGVMGMPGVTAWVGLKQICKPKAGETVVVSAAAGAVGSAVGQIAKILGCRAVGIAGGPDKCRHVVEDLGFDACIDYKAGRLREDLAAACPNGIDACFENVGAQVFDEVLQLLNPFSRIALCGLVAQYNATEAYGYKNLRSLLVNRVRLEGFIVFDHLSVWEDALGEMSGWILGGQMKYRETVARGLENAPGAFISLLKGGNLGKQLVQLA